MKTRIDIFSGFLGAGKTMLIKKLIEEKLYSEKILIIENEFGEVSIDGPALKKSNLQVKEVNSGCICCTLLGDFRVAIEEALKSFKPDRIIIEPSGVGQLSEILSVCKVQELAENIQVNMVITVVDVLKFNIYMANFGEFYKNQIVNAKTIVLSRTQKASMPQLQKVIESIRKLNSKATIITTPWDKLDGEKIIEAAQADMKSVMEKQLINIKKPNLKGNLHSQKILPRHNADEVFDTWGVETPKVFNMNEIKAILKALEDENLYGHVLRAKGIIQVQEDKWIQFDYVPEESEIQSTNADYSGRICVIGSNLNKEQLFKLFLK